MWYSCTIKDVGNADLGNPDDINSEESIGFTCPLDKAYRFFQDGHVQNIRHHPMLSQLNYICIGADVLPSMMKDYKVYIVLSEHTSNVHRLSVHAQLGCLAAAIMPWLLYTALKII